VKGHASEGALAPPLQQPQRTFGGAMVEMNATRMQRRNAAHLRQMPSCGETPSLCGGCRPVQWSWPAQLQSPPLYGKQGDTCAGEAIAGSLPSWQFLLLSHVPANHRIAGFLTMLPSQSNHMAAARHHLLSYCQQSPSPMPSTLHSSRATRSSGETSAAATRSPCSQHRTRLLRAVQRAAALASQLDPS